MKTFSGNKPLAVVKAQCKAAGIDYNDREFRRVGSDFVCITTVKGQNHTGQVLYNTFNGRFFGTTPDGTEFSSDSTKFENEAWFQALLSFFYVESKRAA